MSGEGAENAAKAHERDSAGFDAGLGGSEAARGGHAPIRVAIAVESERVPAFIAACVADIAERQGIEIAAVLPDEHVAERRPVTLRGRVEQLYEAVERLVYRGGRRALRLTDLPAEVAQTPRSLLDVRHSGSIDVLVDLRRQHRGLPIAEPRYGRWHLEFAAGEGAPRRARLDRPGPDTHLVEAVLVGERGTDRRCDLEHSIGSIDRIAFARTRDATYWKAAAFPGRRLEALRSHGPQALRGLVGPRTGATRKQGGPPAVEAPLSPDADGGRRPPGPPIGAFLRAAAVRLMERLVYADGWVVLSRPREPGTGPPADVSGFREIPAPSGRFFADPFVVADATATHLFVEDCPNGRHQGELSRLTLGVDGTWSNPTVILKRDHHLSYPHVVRIGNDTFLTPDGGGRIDLYRSVGWPDHWEHTSTILADAEASDPTLLVHDGRCWLFAIKAGPGAPRADELFLYSAPGPLGPWEAHPANPVVSDVRRARPAGRVFVDGGRLIRPGQDCSMSYGLRVVLNEITVLTPTEYQERPVGSIEPRGYARLSRTHCYTADGRIEVLDGYVRRPRLRLRSR